MHLFWSNDPSTTFVVFMYLCNYVPHGIILNQPLQRWNIFYIHHGDQRVYQFEIIINILVSSLRFIWIPMSWVYGHYKYFTLLVRGPTFTYANTYLPIITSEQLVLYYTVIYYFIYIISTCSHQPKWITYWKKMILYQFFACFLTGKSNKHLNK